MPIFQLFTNIPGEKITDDILNELSSKIAGMLGKPEHYVFVHILGDQKLFYGRSGDPSGFAVLKSVGAVGGENNKNISRELFPLVERLLGIPGKSMFIEFIDIPSTDIANDGKPFDVIFAEK